MRVVIERLKWLVVVALVITAFNALTQAASAPTKITVQGRLTDPSGTPAPAGSKPFVFKIYDAGTFGTEIWPNGVGENQNVNTDANGLWTAEVGSVIPLTSSVFGASTRWLQITVNGEALSRLPINTTPYAYRVATLEGAGGGEIGDTMGVRDPGGNVAVYGANGMAFTASGGATTGPQGITFIDPSGDTTLSIPVKPDSVCRIEMRGDTGTLAYSGLVNERQLLLTTADVAGYSDSGFTNAHSGPMLVLRDTLGMNANDVLVSAGGGLAYRGTNTGNGHFGPGGLLMTGAGGTDTIGFWNPLTGRVGINTGHPTEALTVGGAISVKGAPNSTPVDPWIGARKAMVVAKESADEWGRSTDDSAGIFLPANTSDYSILSSKTSANQTILRMSVGDDPEDHILLMPSGDVGIGTNAPTQKLTVNGTVYSTSGGFKFPDGTTQTTASFGGGSSSLWQNSGLDIYADTAGADNYSVGINTTTPNSALQVVGPIATALTSSSATSVTLGATSSVWVGTAAFPLSQTVNLPTAVGLTGRRYTIKRTGSASVTIDPNGAQTIDGAASYTLSTQWEYVVIVSNGSNWLIVGDNF